MEETKKETEIIKSYDSVDRPKKLDFIKEFAAELGISLAKIADESGKTRQLMTYYMKKDDMMLDNAQGMIKALGYRLEFSYTKDIPKSYILDIEIDEEELKKQKRLAFIKKAFMKYNITSKETAKKLGIRAETIKYWFINDNVAIGYLYKIAEIWGLSLKIRITPLKKEIDTIEEERSQ